MNLTKQPYKGTRDFFPALMRERNYLFHQMQRTAESFSYEPYDGPLLEEVELYLAKSGEELINEQIYSFIDRGERKVAIRPEMTPTLARMVAQIHREQSKPLRWYAIPNLMRYEKPQKGRLREHWQFNCDIFGAPAGQGELEILQVAIQLFENFGANQNHFEILVNDRRIVDAFFEKNLALTKEKSYRLYKIIDKAKKVSPEALDKMLSEILNTSDLKNTFLRYLNLKNLNDLEKFLNEQGLSQAGEELIQLCRQCEAITSASYIHYDPTIVRGLDYYTGLVFEIFDKNPENRRALCGGGAYANLLQIFNEPALPGIGFGLGDVTLTDFLKTHNLMPAFAKPEIDLLIGYLDPEAQKTAHQLAKNLRQLQLKVEVFLGAEKVKKIFSQQERRGHKAVCLLGSQEIQTGKVEVKRSSPQSTAPSLDKNTKKVLSFQPFEKNEWKQLLE
jgi:histidyl-tRNA synthetase